MPNSWLDERRAIVQQQTAGPREAGGESMMGRRAHATGVGSAAETLPPLPQFEGLAPPLSPSILVQLVSLVAPGTAASAEDLEAEIRAIQRQQKDYEHIHGSAPRESEAASAGPGELSGSSGKTAHDAHGCGGSPARLQGGARAPDEKMFKSARPQSSCNPYSLLLQNISKVVAGGAATRAEDSDRYIEVKERSKQREREHQREVEHGHGHAGRAVRPPPPPAAATSGGGRGGGGRSRPPPPPSSYSNTSSPETVVSSLSDHTTWSIASPRSPNHMSFGYRPPPSFVPRIKLEALRSPRRSDDEGAMLSPDRNRAAGTMYSPRSAFTPRSASTEASPRIPEIAQIAPGRGKKRG